MSEQSLHAALRVAWFILSAVVFIALQFLSAPYGRHARAGWGPSIPDRAGWVLMELPAVLVFPTLALLGPRGADPVVIFAVALWLLHYVPRTFVFPFLAKKSDKRMPLLIALLAAATNVGVGYLLGRGIGAFDVLPSFGILAVIGSALFLAGFAINQWADRVLIALRRPGETGYKVPEGGLYRFVSSPNYAGEILEWAGFVLATMSPSALAFLAWTLANLVPRAAQNHAWYRARFPEYPSERRRLIPFVW